MPFGLPSNDAGVQGNGGAGILFTGTTGQTLRVNNTGSILGGDGAIGGAGIQIDGGTAELVNQAGGLISSNSTAIRSTSPDGGVQVFNYGTISAPLTAISFDGSAGAANSVTLYGGSTTVGALEFNGLSGGETLEFAGAFSGNFNNTVTGLNVLKATGNSSVTLNSLAGYAISNGTVDVASGSTITVAGILLDGSSSTRFAKSGAGKLLLSANNSYSGGTTINSGIVAAAVESISGGNKVVTLNPNALGSGDTTINAGGTLFVPSTSLDGAHLAIGGNLTMNNGAIAFYDIGTSPLGQDLRIDVAGNFTASAGNNTFDFSAVEALDYGTYTLVNATAVSVIGTNFVAAHGQYTRLFGNFTTPGNTVVYTVTSATSGGPDIQNNGGPNTPVVAVFDVTQPTRTIGSNNMVNALNFSNNASLTINATGQLTVSSGNLNVQSGGTSVVSGGTLNTTGNLTKLGVGELDLLSATNINGTATVEAGLLSVNNQLNANSVVIDTVGTLGGNGTITAPGGMTIAGTFAPGNSPGVISVVSNPVWTSTSNTVIEIAGPSTFDSIAVTGPATLAGNMTVVQFGGFQLAYGGSYEIVTATGGISGNFSEIIFPVDFENSRGRFLVRGTTGTLLIAPLSYVPMALNQNQRNAAGALDSFILATGGDRQTVSIALDSLTAAQYPAAFDAIMPGFYETLGDMVIEQAYNQTQLLNQRLSSVRLGATGFQAIGMSQPLKYDIDGDSVAEASTLDFASAARGENGVWTPARIGRMAGGAPAAPAPYAPLGTNWNSWVMGIGEFAMSRGLSGVPNYNNNAGGFLAGADYRFGPTLSAGVYAGYQYNCAKYSNGSSTQGNSALFGLYASYANEGGYYADAVIGGGYTGFQTRRSIEFPGIDRTATADPGSGQFSAALNLGKDFEVGKFTLGPIVGAQYTYAGIGAFTESGADSLNLSLDQQNVNSLRTNLGARLAYNWEICKNTVLIPEVRGFWMHEFLNNPANITSSLNGGAGPSFDYETETPYRDSIFGGVGVSAKLGERWSASAFYNVNFGAAGYTNNIISTTLGFSF